MTIGQEGAPVGRAFQPDRFGKSVGWDQPLWAAGPPFQPAPKMVGLRSRATLSHPTQTLTFRETSGISTVAIALWSDLHNSESRCDGGSGLIDLCFRRVLPTALDGNRRIRPVLAPSVFRSRLHLPIPIITFTIPSERVYRYHQAGWPMNPACCSEQRVSPCAESSDMSDIAT